MTRHGVAEQNVARQLPLVRKLALPASDAYSVGMQYTLRDIPKKVDEALRKKAKEQGRSLNDVAVEALAIVSGVVEPAQPIKYRDLSDIAGTYVHDPGFEAAMKAQDVVNPEDWK